MTPEEARTLAELRPVRHAAAIPSSSDHPSFEYAKEDVFERLKVSAFVANKEIKSLRASFRFGKKKRWITVPSWRNKEDFHTRDQTMERGSGCNPLKTLVSRAGLEPATLCLKAHDLRAPFSSILGFTDLLFEDDTLTDVEKQQYIRYIQDSSKSMLALVNSMLDWTRLQTGRIKFEPEKLNAREIIESSINTVSGIALKKGVEIENLVEPALHIYGDKNLILHVFNNLLSNAVKFTKSGDRIMISVNTSSTSRFITFSVKDSGIGIKLANLDKLFSIETKFTSEVTAGEKGSGLGLSLVKDIVEKHGDARACIRREPQR